MGGVAGSGASSATYRPLILTGNFRCRDANFVIEHSIPSMTYLIKRELYRPPCKVAYVGGVKSSRLLARGDRGEHFYDGDLTQAN